jgi:hypothetical protein
VSSASQHGLELVEAVEMLNGVPGTSVGAVKLVFVKEVKVFLRQVAGELLDL